jgi:hypothetical protein
VLLWPRVFQLIFRQKVLAMKNITSLSLNMDKWPPV